MIDLSKLVFGTYLESLNLAGVKTRSARQFWGGVAEDGELVVTTWTDTHDGRGNFYVWKPRTDHGGLKTAWELGNLAVGATVKVILLRQRGNVGIGQGNRSVRDAALLPGKWTVTELVEDKDWQACIRKS